MKMIKKSDFMGCVAIVAFLVPVSMYYVHSMQQRNKFNFKIEYHNQFGNNPNKWLKSDMASNVAEMRDSVLSADFKHYLDLSQYFQAGKSEYDINKKGYGPAQTADSTFHAPLKDAYKEARMRFSKMSWKTNGEFLDSLDKCVVKLDNRYNQLVAAKRAHQK